MTAAAITLVLLTGWARPALAQGSAIFPLDHFWTHVLDAPFAAPPVADARHIYVPLQTGRLVAIVPSANAPAWSAELDVDTAPIAADGRVFAAAAGAIHALDAATGAVKWRLPAGLLAAPLVYRAGWLIVTQADGAIQAVRAADGSAVWALSLGAPAAASPAIDGNLLAIPLADGRIVAMDLPTGKTHWARPLGAVASGLTISGDRVFAGTLDGSFWSLEADDGDIDWRWRVGARAIGAPAADGDAVYVVAADNVVRGFSRGSGNQRWSFALTTRALAGPSLVDGVLVVTTGEVGKPGLTYVRTDTGATGGRTPPLPDATETMRVQYPVAMSTGAAPRAFLGTATPGGDWALHGYRQTFLAAGGIGPLAFGPRYEIRRRLEIRTGIVRFGTAVAIPSLVPEPVKK